MIEVKPSTILVYRNSLLSLECSLHQRMITGCDFCIMNIPCHCSITTKNHYLQTRLATCSNESRNVTTVHPLNLALLQEFFDSSMTEHIYADTTFQRPLNICTPAFNPHKHKMHKVLADDNTAHLNLRKMAQQAKMMK